jgi:hypothetical protein
MLGQLTKKYGDTQTVLTAYHLGEGGLSSRGIDYNYANKVMQQMQSLKRVGE